MTMPDENELSDEELLRMWAEGEPVAILTVRVAQSAWLRPGEGGTLGRISEVKGKGWPAAAPYPVVRESVATESVGSRAA